MFWSCHFSAHRPSVALKFPTTEPQTQMLLDDLSVRCDWMFRELCRPSGKWRKWTLLKAFAIHIFRTTVLTKWTTKFHKIKSRLFIPIAKAFHYWIQTYFSRPMLSVLMCGVETAWIWHMTMTLPTLVHERTATGHGPVPCWAHIQPQDPPQCNALESPVGLVFQLKPSCHCV